MAIKVQFEIGHTATVKTKRTPEGFTHGWELYVQGVNKADISAFVDKVVFNLHDSFPRPKRSIKEPPYVIKESGYAGFELNIDIYFRNRDEPKRVTYSYDLDLQHEGPPHHRCELKKFIFEAPSEDFRQKLVKGGGIAVSAVVGGAITNDDKSIDMSIPDSRNQMVGKPKLSTDASNSASSSSKKHKQRPDDSKLNTFANLFGTPITKSAPKFSPDPKTKTANGGAIAPTAPSAPGNSKGGKDKSNSVVGGATAGSVSSGPAAGSGKDKEKADKKDKHKQQTSPHKDKLNEEKESKKKSESKHDKREEKKKEKKDKEKDRDRVKEKPSKRSLSPKSAAVSAPSPKRPSPVPPSSGANRDEASAKSSSKTTESDKRGTSSSSGKKSKKEKKSHDKERDHKDKHRADVKENVPATSVAGAVANVAPVIPAAAPLPPSKASNSTVAPKTDLNSNKNQKSSEKEKDKEAKKTESKSADKESTPVQTSDKKSSTDKDKKSHKHKKKDKNKEKEKEKEKDKDKDQPSKKSTSGKDKKDKKDKTGKAESAAPTSTTSNNNSSAISKKPTSIPEVDTATESGNTKLSSVSTASLPKSTETIKTKQSNNAPNTSTVPITNSVTTSNAGTASSASALSSAPNDLSDVDSLNSESLHTVSNSNSDKAAPLQNSDSSNCSFPELPAAVPKSAPVFQAPANPQPTPPTTPLATAAPVAITEPTRPLSATQQIVEKKTHRSGAEKSKADKAAEKEDKKRRRNSTAVNTFVEPPLKQIKKDLKPAREKSQSPLLRAEEKQTFLPPPATTSTLPAQNTPVAALNLEYLSELQELHQKIMTLQDNEELQQVVEMIAATGRYEITSKTFDFDLCKLDRHTVQRLQDFFATSVS